MLGSYLSLVRRVLRAVVTAGLVTTVLTFLVTDYYPLVVALATPVWSKLAPLNEQDAKVFLVFSVFFLLGVFL